MLWMGCLGEWNSTYYNGRYISLYMSEPIQRATQKANITVNYQI